MNCATCGKMSLLDGQIKLPETPGATPGERQPHGEPGELFPEMESPDNVSLPKLALDMIVMRNAMKDLQERVERLENERPE